MGGGVRGAAVPVGSSGCDFLTVMGFCRGAWAALKMDCVLSSIAGEEGDLVEGHGMLLGGG